MISKTRRKPISILMTFLIVFSTISSTIYLPKVQAAEIATLAAWDITSAPASSTVLASSGTVATTPVAVTGSAIVAVSGPAITAGAELATNTTYTVSSGYATGSMKTTGWDNGAYKKFWQIAISSKGYENLTFTAKTRSSGTGPKDFVIQYSTNGIDFTDISTYQNTASLENRVGLVPLPTAASNSDTLIIRLTMASDINVNNTAVPAGGVSNVNNIVIQGTPVVSDTAVNAVEASYPSGELLSTDLITLTCATPGAAITYSMNDGTYNSYSEPFSITKFPATLKVKATASGLTDSVVTVYEYTQVMAAAVTATPNGGAVSLDRKIELKCSTLGANIQYSLDEGVSWIDYTQSFSLSKLPAKVLAKATLAGAAPSAVNEFDFTQRTGEQYNIYFGQLHSHTSSSDGLGTVEEAFQHAANDVYNLDFLAVTDHSNSLEDIAGTANITDGSSSTKWLRGHQAADAVTTADFVGLLGYEMTWSNGTGHINTYNTNGFENRNVAKYKTTTGLLEYYNALKTVPASMSQFNHPGETFGDFNDFAHYDAEIDNLITLIEVGNGEGAVHGSGYFTSYEYYTRALDKGWHVAPTNNQDNHKSLWGDANTARSVVLADSLTRDNIYDAMKNMRVYATEDNNLNIYYTLNEEEMGTVIASKPSTVDIKVEIEDEGQTPAIVSPDSINSQEAIGTVEVIVNGGKVAASQVVTASQATVEFELKADYSYYYIRITQADKDIAVTAPIWVGEVDKAGLSGTTTTTALPIKGEPLDITTGLFNNESYDMKVKSLEYSINGEIIHAVDIAAKGLGVIAPLSTAAYSFQYIRDYAGTFNIDIKMVAELQGVEKVFTDVLKVQITDPSLVTKIVVDGSHRNDYVNGYYSGNMTNFIALGANSKTQIKVATEITDEVLAEASVFMISAPLKKSNYTVDGVIYNPQEFSDEFIAMVKRYVDKGGNLIICGIADYQDNTTKDSAGNSNQYQTSTQLNKLLEGIGATSRINNDQVMDNDNNGGQAYRLYFTNYNTASNNALLSGVGEKQKYSFYSGCSIVLDNKAMTEGNVTWLVKGHPTTFSNDTKNTLPSTLVDNGNVCALATEKLAGGGNMLIGGTVYTSNFEIQAKEVDNYDDIYSNSVIISNLIKSVQNEVPTTTIAEARKGKMGDVFAVEGYVTAGTVTGNAFYDTIYIQDETGGMDIYPISEEGILPGQKMRIIGSLDTYQGDLELRVISSEKISQDINLVSPIILTTKAAMDYDTNGGKLVKVTGKVTELILANNSISAFKIKDSSGVEARILIDGYILDSTGKNNLETIIKTGNEISVIGIVYYNPEGVNLRVRDRAEINLITHPDPVTPVIPSTNYNYNKVETSVITVNMNKESWESGVAAVTEMKKRIESIPKNERPTVVYILPEGKPINTEVLEEAKGSDIDLVFFMPTYKWVINGSTITNEITRLKEIDLSVLNITEDKTNVVSVKEFRFAYKGALPFSGKLTLNVGLEYKNRVLFLSSYNEDTKTLEPGGYVKVNSEGMALLTFTNASKYVISVENPILPTVITKKTINLGSKYVLKVKNLLTGDEVSFYSSKESVAIIDVNGEITTKKAGTATITTKVIQNGKTYIYKTKIKVKTPKLTQEK